MNLQSIARKVRHGIWVHAGQIALVVACVGIAGGIWANSDQTDARISAERRQRLEQARSQVKGNRQGCRERNVRDGKIMAGIRTIAASSDVPPLDYLPLTQALSPRNCSALYPQPNRNGVVRRGRDDAGLHFRSCREADAAGVTRIYEGQPGYSSKLDRDGDGIACE